MNTQVKHENELLEVEITITNAGKGTSKYFFDYSYSIRGEESGTLYDCNTGRVNLVGNEVLSNECWGEFDIKSIFQAIIRKLKVVGKGDGVKGITLIIEIDNISKKSYIGLGNDLACPVLVLKTTLRPLVITRQGVEY